MIEHYAVARFLTIPTVQALRRAANHAARRDASAKERRRADADPACLAVGWRGGKACWIGDTDPGSPLPHVTDLNDAYRARKKATGARDRKGNAVALHCLVGVSPAWLEETGSIHDVDDPGNPRVRKLLSAAIRWGQEAFGKGAVLAARMDLDDTGGGIVDLIVTPVHPLKLGRSKKAEPTVSVARGLDLLAKKHERPRQEGMAAGVDSWTEYAQQHLDPQLKRGEPARETGRRHVPPTAYRQRMQELEQERARLEAQIEALHELLRLWMKYAESAVEVLDQIGEAPSLPQPATPEM